MAPSLTATCRLIAIGLSIVTATRVQGQSIQSITGEYRRQPVENSWHSGKIVTKQEGGKQILEWVNDAGKKWNLYPDLQRGFLTTGPRNPYRKNGSTDFALEHEGKRVIGFAFNGEFYLRKGERRIVQKSGGFKGYISMQVPRPPEGFGYGASFYAAIWPLVSRPLAGFQIGLPSTWIVPNNRDFKQALVPPSTRAHAWKERAPIYHDVFQTIEGGLGYWVSTQFGSAVPKYRMNGTSNGYTHEISSPGWGFGRTTPLTPAQMGIAQLSNRILVPPDGLTFGKLSKNGGELLGNAWMALPLVPAREGPEVPTGNQSWTLFLRAANFKGAVAFWIPDTWSRLSRSYRTIVGRGLDARPGVMGSGAMEVNTVPYFELKDATGTVFTKIPRLQFPVDETGITVLMQDITLYSADAIFSPMLASTASGGRVPSRFDPRGAWKPDCKAIPITFRQGPQDVPLKGFEKTVQTTTFGEGARNSFGLKWTRARGKGTLPQYYRHADKQGLAVAPSTVPAKLAALEFRPAHKRSSYTSASDNKPPRPHLQARLSDGSVVTYAWFRFIDQPSIRALGWNTADLNRLQKKVEDLHTEWLGGMLPPPSQGTLVALDTALLVRPPRGKQKGYVPIAIRQSMPTR